MSDKIKTEVEMTEIDLSTWLEPFDDIKLGVDIVEFFIKFVDRHLSQVSSGEDLPELARDISSFGFRYIRTLISLLEHFKSES